jgi:hypothetical protein
MRSTRSVFAIAILALGFVPMLFAQAPAAPAPAPAAAPQPAYNQGSAMPEPNCPYGYYSYAPYDCAPPGFYGPSWFVNGVFIGAGPWYRNIIVEAPPVMGPEPVCSYGYYSYYPYSCAPYGYYGREWFRGGIFIGIGHWHHGGFGIGFGGPFFRGGWGWGGGYHRGGDYRAPRYNDGQRYGNAPRTGSGHSGYQPPVGGRTAGPGRRH